MKREHTWAAAVSLAAVSAIALTGCSSHTDTGTAKAADASPAAVKLDTGTYRTTPQPDFGKAGTPAKGAIIEGQRMAEYVVHPFDIDPSLTKMAQMSTYVIKNVDALGNILPKPIPDSIAGDHFVTGFSTSASDAIGHSDPNHSNVHAVLRFTDPASAQKAANDLHQALLTTNLNANFPELPPNVGTEDHISVLPNSLVDTHDTDGQFSLDAITPHGPYVFYDWFQGKDSTDPTLDPKVWAAKSAASAVQQQGPKIDAFPATPVDKLANLPMDIDGVLRLTIPPTADNATVNTNAVYGPNGFLNFSGDPITDKDLIQQSGMDRVAMGGTNVYRTRDDQGAQVLFNGFAKQYAANQHAAPAVPGVPGSKCWVLSDANVSQTACLISRGRYVGEITAQVSKPFDLGDSTTPTKPAPAPGSDITQAHQMAAAQYEILAGQN